MTFEQKLRAKARELDFIVRRSLVPDASSDWLDNPEYDAPEYDQEAADMRDMLLEAADKISTYERQHGPIEIVST